MDVNTFNTEIEKAKKKKELKYIFTNSVYKKDYSYPLNICILNAPCNGFGDLIFAWKLYKYLKEWYNANVCIATTLYTQLLNLGVEKDNIHELKTDSYPQCRRFKKLKFNPFNDVYDLIFVAPVQVDFNGDLKDVRYIFPYANMFNTFFFSEYNDNIGKHDFNLGVGKKRDGLFMEILFNSDRERENSLPNEYAIIYISDNVAGYVRCINSFCSMIARKYHKKINDIDVIIPNWVVIGKSLIGKISKYYNISVKEKIQTEVVYNKNKSGRMLTFRKDIYPVSNERMVGIIKNSIKDILITGDQSLSDVLACCPDKNIYYQIAPWKESLGKNLAREMHVDHFQYKKTSCGGISSIKYKSNNKKFIKKWDFRYNGKDKLDKVIESSYLLKEDKEAMHIRDIILSSKTVKSIKKKLATSTYRTPF